MGDHSSPSEPPPAQGGGRGWAVHHRHLDARYGVVEEGPKKRASHVIASTLTP